MKCAAAANPVFDLHVSAPGTDTGSDPASVPLVPWRPEMALQWEPAQPRSPPAPFATSAEGPAKRSKTAAAALEALAESVRKSMMKLLRCVLGAPLFCRMGNPHREAGWGAAALFSASLFLTSCTGPTPEPKVKVVEVKIPVTVACVKSDVNLSPVYPDTDEKLRATAGPDDMLQLLAAGRLLRVQTMKEWAAALKACQG